jgi:hypothetical protein
MNKRHRSQAKSKFLKRLTQAIRGGIGAKGHTKTSGYHIRSRESYENQAFSRTCRKRVAWHKYRTDAFLKQYLSTHDLSELDAPLPTNIDPTGRYTARSSSSSPTFSIRPAWFRRLRACPGRSRCASRVQPGIEAGQNKERPRFAKLKNTGRRIVIVVDIGGGL